MAQNFGSVTQSRINTVTQRADAIPNYNVWTAIGKGVLKGASAYYNARAEQKQLEFQSVMSFYDSVIAINNAQFSKNMAQLRSEASLNDMYSVYRQGEHQAMLQGLHDSRAIHKEQARTASSGVRMNSGSKAEVNTTQKLSAVINQQTIQENVIRTASQLKLESVNAEITGILEEANYMAQAYIAQGDSEAAQIMADTIDPVGEGILAGLSTFAGSFMGGGGFGGFKK